MCWPASRPQRSQTPSVIGAQCSCRLGDLGLLQGGEQGGAGLGDAAVRRDVSRKCRPAALLDVDYHPRTDLSGSTMFEHPRPVELVSAHRREDGHDGGAGILSAICFAVCPMSTRPSRSHDHCCDKAGNALQQTREGRLAGLKAFPDQFLRSIGFGRAADTRRSDQTAELTARPLRMTSR